jgi:exodeoxyribonuclease VII large subunit
LFDEKYKKEIPSFPKKIGLITAAEGAAVKDMISVAKRRYPLVELLIVPTKVQGVGAKEDIVENIRKLNFLNDIDVIILARGGGSIEDLWAFNEEIVARAIFKSKIPIISGVGHEVDFTIADFVSDLRAPTPSVAMELATPDIQELKSFIKDSYSLSCDVLERILDNYRNEIDGQITSYSFRYPLEKIRKYSQMIDIGSFKMLNEIEKKTLFKRNKLALLSKSIEASDVDRVLKKGFTLVKQNSIFVKRKIDYNPNNPAVIKFYDGEVEVK